MKLYMYLILSLLSISLAFAVKDDGRLSKVLFQVDDCYNLTIHYSLVDGNSSPVYFDNCIDKGSSSWFCDCKNYTNGFNITLRTDKTILREPREYDIILNYTLYNLYSNFDNFNLVDWGDYAEVDGEDIKYTNSSIKCQSKVKVVYVNNTIEVPVDRIEYRERNVTVVVHQENFTRINLMNDTINNLTANNSNTYKKYVEERTQKNYRNYIICGFAFLVFCMCYYIYKKR